MLILEWCARGSLKDVLYRRSQPFPWALRLKLAYEVAEGLRCMHTNTPKIIHRDIKAENVFLTSDWVAKVGDFGADRSSTLFLVRGTVHAPFIMCRLWMPISSLVGDHVYLYVCPCF